MTNKSEVKDKNSNEMKIKKITLLTFLTKDYTRIHHHTILYILIFFSLHLERF